MEMNEEQIEAFRRRGGLVIVSHSTTKYTPFCLCFISMDLLVFLPPTKVSQIGQIPSSPNLPLSLRRPSTDSPRSLFSSPLTYSSTHWRVGAGFPWQPFPTTRLLQRLDSSPNSQPTFSFFPFRTPPLPPPPPSAYFFPRLETSVETQCRRRLLLGGLMGLERTAAGRTPRRHELGIIQK